MRGWSHEHDRTKRYSQEVRERAVRGRSANRAQDSLTWNYRLRIGRREARAQPVEAGSY